MSRMADQGEIWKEKYNELLDEIDRMRQNEVKMLRDIEGFKG